jgi:hypothetical protein
VLHRLLGRLTDASAAAESALRDAVRLGDRMVAVYAAAELAATRSATGHWQSAGRLWGAIEAEEDSEPVAQWPAERDAYADLVVAADEPDFERGRTQGRTMTLAEAAEVVSPATRS